MDVSWDRVCRDTEELAEKIRASGKEYDAFLGVIKGGATVSGLLGESLDIINIISITVTHHLGGGDYGSAVEISAPLQIPWAKRVLLIDDLIDSGQTLALIKKTYGKKFEIDSAVLYDKGRSDQRPDFCVAEVNTSWITLPWESGR